MLGNTPRLTNLTTSDVAEEVLYIPLEFWFNRNAGLKSIGPKRDYSLVIDDALSMATESKCEKLLESPTTHLNMVKTSMIGQFATKVGSMITTDKCSTTKWFWGRIT